MTSINFPVVEPTTVHLMEMYVYPYSVNEYSVHIPAYVFTNVAQ